MGVEVKLDFRASQSLAMEGLRNEIVRHIQTSRKQAGLDITEKVVATLSSEDDYVLATARMNRDYILQECQLTALEVIKGENYLDLDWGKFSYSPKKWHSQVGILDGELYFGRGELYAHYWEALDAWNNKTKENTK